MSARRIEVHIERIVVQGMPPGDRRALQAAIQTELARLLSNRALAWPESGRHVRSGGTLVVRPKDDASSLGQAVAGAAYRSIVE